MLTMSDIQYLMDTGKVQVTRDTGHVKNLELDLRDLIVGNPVTVEDAGEWRPVPRHEGWYEVSENGYVRRVKAAKGTFSGRILKQHLETTGAKTVRLRIPGEDASRSWLVHRLVCEAFHGPAPEGKPNVLHWDDDRANNKASNLRWGNQSENLRDSVRNGSNYWTSRTHCDRGHPFSGDNLLPRSDSNGRRCKICDVARKDRWYKKKRATLDTEALTGAKEKEENDG